MAIIVAAEPGMFLVRSGARKTFAKKGHHWKWCTSQPNVRVVLRPNSALTTGKTSRGDEYPREVYWFTQTTRDFFICSCCLRSSRAAIPRETPSGCGKSDAGLSP